MIRQQNDLKQLRDKAKSETTDWNRALDLFKKRFFVPFSIEPANQEDVILNLDLPSFKYIFEDNRGSKEVSKEGFVRCFEHRGKESILHLEPNISNFGCSKRWARKTCYFR